MVSLLVPALVAIATAFSSTDGLTVSHSTRDYAASERAATIAKVATQIANGNRSLTFGGETYPLYYGPVPVPGSLTDQIQLEEVKKFASLGSKTPELLANLTAKMAAELTTAEGYAKLYEASAKLAGVEVPMSSDNRDCAFGEQRLTFKSFALRAAKPENLQSAELVLSDKELHKRCDRTAKELFVEHALYVEDFSDASKFNDPKRPDKYVPGVVGFFCETKKTHELLPIEIRLIDTNVTYTPLDHKDDWTLAKMALEAASANYHQWEHMAETHAVTVPLRVEAMRTMGKDHPVLALIQRHVFMDFGLEKLLGLNLLNSSTMLDQISGWGASGSTRFLWRQTQAGISFQHHAFYADAVRRGVIRLQRQKYLAYANLYHKAMSTFVGAYLSVYYTNDNDIVDDVELQNWAKASANIPHVKDFPSAFDTVEQLHSALVHIVFSSMLRHHGMTGRASWHSSSAPYAPAALWKPLPKTKLQKGETRDIVQFAAPVKILPAAMAITVTFYRKVPKSENVFSAYAEAPFSDEKKLTKAIKRLQNTLKDIEHVINETERDETFPYTFLLPSQLPYYTWV